jgi:hypothetical protein
MRSDRITTQHLQRTAIVYVRQSSPADLRPVWEAPSSEMRVKQRIARLLIQEIIADADDHEREIVLVIHWAGGRHSEVRIPRPKPGEHRHRTGPDAEGADTHRPLRSRVPEFTARATSPTCGSSRSSRSRLTCATRLRRGDSACARISTEGASV